MSAIRSPVAIVGGSLAGATTALTLRELGHDGDVLLVGGEAELPYERPALSKEYLLGTMTAEQLQVRPRETYDDLGIQLRLGAAAEALDLPNQQVLLDDGTRVSYAALVVATGASNIRPRIPGLDLPGVHQLRTLSEAAALRAAATAGSRAVVVGMGFIGAEIAATLRQLDVDVTAIEGLAAPLLPQLGPELSQRVRSWHEDQGVRLVFESMVTEITSAGAHLRVRTTTGESFPADVVIVGVGVRPNVGWLTGTPLHSDTGVRVDTDGRTAVPNVYAVGDVAARWDERAGRHRRTEHWSNAIEQGRRVAHTILDVDPPPDPAPYFWSAQYGHYLQYVGEHSSEAELISREDGRRFTGFYVEEGVVRAAVTIDNGKELRHVRALVGHSLDVRLLADASVDVRALRAALPS